MLVWRHHMYSEERAAFTTRGDRLTAGRAASCDICLPSAYVADQALVFERSADGWTIEPTGINSCEYAGRKLQVGTRVPIHDQAEVRLHPFVLKVDLRLTSPAEAELGVAQLDDTIADFVHAVHLRLLELFDCNATDDARDLGAEYLLRLEHSIDSIAVEQGLADDENHALLQRLAGQAVRNVLVNRVIGGADDEDPLSRQQRTWVRMASAVDQRESELDELAEKIEAHLELDAAKSVSKRMETLDREFWPCWNERVKLLEEFIKYLALREIKKQVKDIVYGYGAIEDLLRLPTVSEIMVVGHDQVFIEKRQQSGGTIENSGRRFVSNEAVIAVIDRIVGRCDRQIDQSQPLVDARLEDGSRVHAVIPPIAVSGPCLTIRKFPLRRHDMNSWIDSGGLTPMAARFLEAVVRGERNILVIGGTGSGKTTLLNCLSDWIAPRDRIVTIEDTAELQLQHDHVVQLQTRPANAEGRGELSTRDLVRAALRMRPDRVIVGECRGGEALDMLNAMNTGHDGSMTTLHANSPAESVLRIESMVKSAADFSEAAIHQQISSAIDLVVQVVHRYDAHSDTRRRFVASISEIRSVDIDTGRVDVVDLYATGSGTDNTELRPTGRLPSFGAALVERGLFDLHSFVPSKSTTP